jgi:alpha,alpha-trehalase
VMLALLMRTMTVAGFEENPSTNLAQLLANVSAEFAKLESHSIRPAEGFIKYDYLVPGGYYGEMWDWDGFFIGCHLAHQNTQNAKYLKFWSLNITAAVASDGYVAGCITTKGPRPLMGRFAMKPFLAQGTLLASERLGDYEWVRPIWRELRRVISYREKTQYDSQWSLFFWDNAMQSGADNNVALTNDPKQRTAILATDLCTFQLREYRAMARLARELGDRRWERVYRDRAEKLRAAMLKHMWFEADSMLFNIRRADGLPVRRISYSNFVPLIEDVVPRKKAQAMIRRYLVSEDHMLSKYGFRSLSKQDQDYNNVSMIEPYSNWQGPVWINANYLYYIALKRYGFDADATQLAGKLGRVVLKDIKKWNSMHENYNAETGEGVAPTPELSPDHKFTGFVGWNLLVQDMLQCEVERRCELLQISR